MKHFFRSLMGYFLIPFTLLAMDDFSSNQFQADSDLKLDIEYERKNDLGREEIIVQLHQEGQRYLTIILEQMPGLDQNCPDKEHKEEFEGLFRQAQILRNMLVEAKTRRSQYNARL